MTENTRRDERDQNLIRAIRNLPQAEPPAGFTQAVLSGLAPKRLAWWQRAWLWARTPRPLAVTPLRLAGAALAAGLLVLAALPLLPRPQAPGMEAPAGGLQAVTFLLPDPDGRVRSAAVIGTFNRWNPKGFEMRFMPEQKAWLLQTRLAAGSHEYVFLLDGAQLRPDPAAVLTKDDGFGNSNSVLLLGDGHEQRL